MHRVPSPTIGAARAPDHVPAPLRQVVVSVRERGCARESGADLYRGGPDQDDHAAGRGGLAEVTDALARYAAAKAELDAAAQAGVAALRARRSARSGVDDPR